MSLMRIIICPMTTERILIVKSNRTSLILAVIGVITLAVLASTLFGVIAIRNIGNRSADNMLLHLCESGEKNLDAYFNSVERSVEMVSAYAEADLNGLDDEALLAHLDRAREVFANITYKTIGVLTYYYRIDPSVSGTAKGFWFTNLNGTGFEEHEVTDITLYNTEDTSSLVWFTVPKATGQPVWLSPYVTDNLDVRVISYNVPIYWGKQFVGVIGIEIDYSAMAEEVNHISLYENGYAFLTDGEGNVVYHPRLDVAAMDAPPRMDPDLAGEQTSFRYTFEGVRKQAVWMPLSNGTRLYVAAPVAEISAEWQRSVVLMVVGALGLLATVILMAVYIVRILHRNEETREAQARLEKELRSVTELTELMGSMSSLLTNMPAMSFSKDAETGVYLACNQAFAEYAGKKEPKDVVGLTDHEIFDTVTADHFVEDDKKALAMEGAYIFFEDVPDAFCSVTRNLQTTKKKYRDATGRLCLLGMCVDVTETTRAKAEQAANEVREAEEREKQALEAFYKKDVERLSYQASHDELTGLYNRFGYDFLISEIDLSSVYLLMVDVDDFKAINDNFGHEVGDRVLIKIAETLKLNFRSDDCICRVGGDEFVVVMTHANTGLRALVESKVEKINRELTDTADGLPPISVSVGITFGSEAADAIELLKLADLAMYELKRNGKRGYRFSDEG